MSQSVNIIDDIESFLQLSPGWDFGVGDTISSDVISKAISLVKIAMSLGLLVEAIPEINGGIVLTLIYNEDSLEIRINDNLTYSIIYERGLGQNHDVLYRLKGVSEIVVRDWIRLLFEQGIN